MKLKKKALNQGFIKKLFNSNPIFLIFCTLDSTLSLKYKSTKLCKNNFRFPTLLFSFDFSSRVQNFILCKENISLMITLLRLNYFHLANYGFTFLYLKNFYFKELSAAQLYFFEPKKLLHYFKSIFVVKEALSSSNGKDIALSRWKHEFNSHRKYTNSDNANKIWFWTLSNISFRALTIKY